MRKLHEKMKDPGFTNDLLNTLKNKRRLQMLAILSNRRHSIIKVQKEMRESGYHHSQGTLLKEYIHPLTENGIARRDCNRYHATLFGLKLNELMKSSSETLDSLPPRSKCYEEIVIESLDKSPKTFEELESTIATKSLSRVLERLQEADLISKDNERSYIFFFRTKRDRRKEKLSPTEKRGYESIPEEGIAAQELADRAAISVRRTYKYLRKLRGKKLVFKRKLPKKYSLTEKGTRIASLLQRIQALLIEFLMASKGLSEKASDPIDDSMVLDTLKDTRMLPPQQQILAKSKIQ